MNKMFRRVSFLVTASILCVSCSGSGGTDGANRAPNANDVKVIKVPQPEVNSNVPNQNTNSVPANKASAVPAMSSPTPLPAPDNSTLKSEMLKDGSAREVREFKDDPMIIKVERRISSEKTRYFVYLKNGKVVEAPAEKMNDYRILAPANILDIIGIKPPAPNSANTGPQSVKQKN